MIAELRQTLCCLWLTVSANFLQLSPNTSNTPFQPIFFSFRDLFLKPNPFLSTISERVFLKASSQTLLQPVSFTFLSAPLLVMARGASPATKAPIQELLRLERTRKPAAPRSKMRAKKVSTFHFIFRVFQRFSIPKSGGKHHRKPIRTRAASSTSRMSSEIESTKTPSPYPDFSKYNIALRKPASYSVHQEDLIGIGEPLG